MVSSRETRIEKGEQSTKSLRKKLSTSNVHLNIKEESLVEFDTSRKSILNSTKSEKNIFKEFGDRSTSSFKKRRSTNGNN